MIDKNNFIKIISTLSIEEINKIIKEKGKKPKLITPIVFTESNKKITDFFTNFLIEGDNTNVLDKNNYHRNGIHIIEDGIEQEEKFIDLYGDYNSSLILNYRNQNQP